MDTTATAWEKALSLLRDEVDEFQYLTWFAPLTPHLVGNDHLVLEAKDNFIISVVRTRFSVMIENAVMLSAGKRFTIDFVGPGEAPQAAAEKAVSEKPYEAMLNPRYTFDTFVVGTSNRFAHAAALAVAELPSDAYNPLFLYGGVGLGKTHLMHAIGHYLISHNPGIKLMYITSENFTNQLIASIAKKTNQEFRDRLRNVDVLMVDDIQFIAGKTATQEEFFHTFNELHSSGKQIVISSDRPPKDIPTLEERLRSRFEWGLIADIGRPDYETRIAILRKKAELEHIDVDDEVLHFIAEQSESNIRELEGALTRVNAVAQLTGGRITTEIAKNALDRIISGSEKRALTPEAIMDQCAKHCGLTRDDLLSQKRNREIARSRQLAMYLMRELTALSTTRIGELLGGRDHTTVMHACERIGELSETDMEIKASLEALRKELKG